MKNEEYIVIQGWMYRLPLTEKQRLIYALIWGYSRDGRSACRASALQLAEWAGCKIRNAQYIVRQLEDLGLVDHRVVAVPKKGNRPGGCMSEFWAVLPEDATRPEIKDRIDWAGRGVVTQNLSQIAQPGYATDCVTSNKDTTRNKYISGCGCKNSARSRAKKTTTTTEFLFENESGLTPGDRMPMDLPFEERYFVEGWERLMREPKWQGKTPGQLELQLERFRDTGDPEVCAYCMDLAIRRGWDFIEDPSRTAAADHDKFMAFCDAIRAREEGAKA